MSSTPHQPYRCSVCGRCFTRHENLKRHAALHSQSRGRSLLRCEFCTATFSRSDLRNRHVQRKHPEHAEKPITRPRPQKRPDGICLWENGETARPGVIGTNGLTQQPEQYHVDYSRGGFVTQDINFTTNDVPAMTRDDSHSAVAASRVPPRDKAIAGDRMLRVMLNDHQNLVTGKSLSSQSGHLDRIQPLPELPFPSFDADMTGFDFISSIADKCSPNSPSQFQDDEWSPSASQSSRGCDLFFAHVAHYVPFVHPPTFDRSRIPPYLLLSMLCLSYQYGEDPECEYQIGTGASLSRRCFHRARAYISTIEEEAEEPTQQLSLVQSYLLLQICAMMFLCGKESFYGLRAHSKMISHARSGGFMRPALDETQGAGDLETLWYGFAKAESLKRTLFAVHQIDALWYQVLSVPRQLSHLEIRFELPCTEELWSASSSAEWAHRRLVSRQAGPSISYPDAVRQFLSPEIHLSSFPAFDPYGAINITQFLISSAREISGWCTMTGRISLDRFEPLKAALPALGHVICQQSEPSDSRHPSLPEMTWHIAMLEIEVWSPSHVGGIVEGSVDSLLKQSSYLSPHIDLLCEPSIASAIQPHVDWFLRYLDTSITPDLEAPWVILYAYKAFLIAWQFMRGRSPGSMDIVGVLDGDEEGALKWAKKVFQRRERWQLGRLVLERLGTLRNEYLESVSPRLLV
ncbi:hypothetical protein NUW58_g1233 [Xylaria curta]|uniref:Uncharacterized protein n=1 Tax=Xylaria curta TaxID=42375 RepID=A0ACC1PMZ1_9PEZI|nr:hypothetical protein NUW58_g1233 [Xylaria curta]